MYITHIQPVNSQIKVYQPIQMYLAHLIMKYPFRYTDVKEIKSYKIMDNSYHELGYSLPIKALVHLAEQIGADEIVLPDRADVDEYIEHLDNDIDACRGYNTMAVVHADTWQELGEQVRFFCSIPQLTTIGLPKPVANLVKGGIGRLEAAKLIEVTSKGSKQVHFLGSGTGLHELVDNPEVLKSVRSMDTGYFLTQEAYDRPILEKRDSSIIIDLETKNPLSVNKMFLRIKEVSEFVKELQSYVK